MPLVSVMRWSTAGVYADTATQAVVGTLDVSDGVFTVEVDPTTFTASGTYTVFSYGTFTGPLANLAADLSLTSFTTYSFADTGSAITLTLS